MNYTFTQEHLDHIRKNGFNPQICKECYSIDIALKDNAQLISGLYKALADVLFDLQHGFFGDNPLISERQEEIEQALAKAERIK